MERNLTISNYIAFVFITWLSNSTEDTLPQIWNTNHYLWWGSGQATPKYATWHIDCFEFKLLEKQPVQDGHPDPALFPPESRK